MADVFVDGQKFDGFETLAVWEGCASIAGIRVCAAVNVNVNGVELCLIVGRFRRCWSIGGNGCFEWNANVAKVKSCIKDFTLSGGKVCFKLSIEACVGSSPFQICQALVDRRFCIDIPHPTLAEIQVLGRGEQQYLYGDFKVETVDHHYCS